MALNTRVHRAEVKSAVYKTTRVYRLETSAGESSFTQTRVYRISAATELSKRTRVYRISAATPAPPTAKAGSDLLVDPNIYGTWPVDGSGSTAAAGRTIASSVWHDITSGTAVLIPGTGLVREAPVHPTMQGGNVGTFRLTVTDDMGATNVDTVTHTYMPHTRWTKTSAGGNVPLRRFVPVAGSVPPGGGGNPPPLSSIRLTKNSSSGVVQRSGIPYASAGANVFQLASNDYPSPRLMSHAEIDSVLDKAVALGANIVRAHTLGVSVGPSAWHLVSGVTGTTTPVVAYRNAVWEVIDYAIKAAGDRGIYLMVPMTDELGYYHGGKRTWVNFRRPGTCSTDFNVKSANSPTERAAENYFYTDGQIVADFRKYVSDWLNRINQYTEVAYKNDPTVAIIETGNEMWTAAQDAPTWTPGLAGYIKSIAPNVLVADGAATDGQVIVSTHLNSPDIDIHGTHPYSTFGASNITSMAAQAAGAGKAFFVGEYPWSKSQAPAIEQAALAAPNCFGTAFWSLQLDADLHNNGVAYGTDDVSLYYPGKDSTQTAAVSRLKTLDASFQGRA